MKTGRHFTASVFIVNDNHVLLHKHKKIGLILPVGGYLEEGELPEEAVVREAKEESGLDIVLYDKDTDKCETEMLKEVNHGQYLTLITVSPEVQQMDFTYFASSESGDISPSEISPKNFTWYTKEMLLKEVGGDFEEDVIKYGLEALDILKD